MQKSSEQTPVMDEEKAAASRLIHKRHVLRCCSFHGGVLFFLFILALTLLFTVFRPRSPVIWLSGSTTKLDLIEGTPLPQPGSNATINANVSIKNRNFVSFGYPSMMSPVYYGGVAVGDARVAAGNFPARRTKRVNVMVRIVLDRVMDRPEFGSDVQSGYALMIWRPRVGGRAKILFVNKRATLRMNCTATINTTALELAQLKCKPKFKLI